MKKILPKRMAFAAISLFAILCARCEEEADGTLMKALPGYDYIQGTGGDPLVSSDNSASEAYSYTADSTQTFSRAIAAINNANGGVHTITVTGNFLCRNIAFTQNSVKKIIIVGDSDNRVISNSRNSVLFAVSKNITLVLGDNITLNGNAKLYPSATVSAGGVLEMRAGSTIMGAKSSGVMVQGGAFIMSGGVISDNTNFSGCGGGVYVSSGSFVMSGGIISGNTAFPHYSFSSYGGGVYVDDGVFAMSGGLISGNTASYSGYSHGSYGGGVYIGGGSFVMSGGAISGNAAVTTSHTYGGGVCIGSGVFTKSGAGMIDSTNSATTGCVVYVDSGNKKRNVTSGPNNKLDSKISGALGGWD
jgi:hypothetical protein